MHDEDNSIGLNIITRKGKHFKFFGDKRLLSLDNAQNLAECKSTMPSIIKPSQKHLVLGIMRQHLRAP